MRRRNWLLAAVCGLGLTVSGCGPVQRYQYNQAKIKEAEAQADVMDMYRQCLKEKRGNPQVECSAYGSVLSVSVK